MSVVPPRTAGRTGAACRDSNVPILLQKSLGTPLHMRPGVTSRTLVPVASFEESHSGIRHHEKLRFRRCLSVSSSEAQLVGIEVRRAQPQGKAWSVSAFPLYVPV